MFAALASSEDEGDESGAAQAGVGAAGGESPRNGPSLKVKAANGKHISVEKASEAGTVGQVGSSHGTHAGDNEEEEEVASAYPDTEYGARQWRSDHGVTVEQAVGGSAKCVYRPVLSFRRLLELGVDAELVEACSHLVGGGAKGASICPTAVQSECWGALFVQRGPARTSDMVSSSSQPPTAPYPQAWTYDIAVDDKVRETFRSAMTMPVPSDSEDDDEEKAKASVGLAEARCEVRTTLDLIAVAPTGSGKTLAYLVPLLADGCCRSHVSLVTVATLADKFEVLFSGTFSAKDSDSAKGVARRFAKLRGAASETGALLDLMKGVLAKAQAMLRTGSSEQLQAWTGFEGELSMLDLLRPRVLVLVPTRELAFQVYTVSKVLGAAASVVVGGVDPERQRETLREEAAALLVATPGRLCALCGHISSGAARRGTTNNETVDGKPGRIQRLVCLAEVQHLVMDEGDRLLDEGFSEEVAALASRCQAKGRHTMLFSATWSAALAPLAKILQGTSIVHITVAGIPPTITQEVEVLPRVARAKRLRELLAEFGQMKVLVFALYKKEARSLAKMLRESGWDAAALQGDMSQAARATALKHFRTTDGAVLVATDVAARGIDISGVNRVINFSFPLSIDSYIHRIGRCGRAGQEGLAVSFVTDGDERHASDLLRILKEANQTVPPGLEEMAAASLRDNGSAGLSIVHSGRRGEVKVVRKKR